MQHNHIWPTAIGCLTVIGINVCRSGLGALELFAMGLKATGSYLSRTLSYDGAEFSIAKVDVDPTFG